jgi:uncharacterized protein YeaO (DUF488 family)
MGMQMPVNIKRAYDKISAHDGARILVDGLWPRGVSKADLKIAQWEKGIAPSKALRTWYGHDPDKWPEFRKRYRQELRQSPRKEILAQLIRLASQGNLTLVFGARDAQRSNAAVIAETIRENLEGS